MKLGQWLLWLTLMPRAAHAGVLIEPYAGYSAGKIKYTYSDSYSNPALAGTTQQGTISGFTYGGRAGLFWSSLMLAAEYQTLLGQQKLDTALNSQSWSNTTMYYIVGVKVWALRLFGGKSFSHESEEGTLYGPITYKGSAWKAGVSLYVLSSVALNVEHIEYTLEEREVSGATEKMKDTFDKLKYTTILFSLSVPLDLFSGEPAQGNRRMRMMR